VSAVREQERGGCGVELTMWCRYEDAEKSDYLNPGGGNGEAGEGADGRTDGVTGR